MNPEQLAAEGGPELGDGTTIEAECMSCGEMQQVSATSERFQEWGDRDESAEFVLYTLVEGQVCCKCGEDDLHDPDDTGDAPSWQSEREDFHSDM